MKKLKKWQIVLIVLGVLIILGTIIDRVEYYKDPQAYKESSIAKQESLEKERVENKEKTDKFFNDIDAKINDVKNEVSAPAYTVNSHRIDTSNPYWTFVRGTLTANKDRTLASIKAEFYDINGVVLSQDSHYIGSIEKGKTYEFGIMATCDTKKIASYKLITE